MANPLNSARVLVTGSDGFIGSHLVEQLIRSGCNVRAFVYYNSFNSWGWLDALDQETLSKIEVFPGDVRDKSLVLSAVQGMDFVFHLAALIGIPYSYVAPQSYIETNVMGTLNVMEACRACGAERVVVTSTSEVYGTAMYVPIDEKHPFQPQSPYAASKIAADSLALSYHKSFGLPVVVARPFNTYGPRQSARAFIPTVLTQLGTGNGKVALGSLEPTRDLTYVTDTCGGLISLASTPDSIGETVNIGTGSEIAIGAVANMLVEMTGSSATIESVPQRIRPRNSEVDRLVCNRGKIFEMTGWAPSVQLHDGLQRTIDWFSEAHNLRGYKAERYNV